MRSLRILRSATRLAHGRRPFGTAAVQEICARAAKGDVGLPFNTVIAAIDTTYAVDDDEPFSVGTVGSGAGENGGSRRVFAVAKRHGLDEASTSRLFCEHYASVVATPDGSDHVNIRAFMEGGWDSVVIHPALLTIRKDSER